MNKSNKLFGYALIALFIVSLVLLISFFAGSFVKYTLLEQRYIIVLFGLLLTSFVGGVVLDLINILRTNK